MNLEDPFPKGDALLAAGYSSASQRARVVTEGWVSKHIYCLACESDKLLRTTSNTEARDFECSRCGHPYELKSSSKTFGTRVVDGAYSSMMRRINSSTLPSFLLLHYTSSWDFVNLFAIHHVLITQDAIEKRKALAVTARRAGWIGCNLLLENIPPEGRIGLICDGVAAPRATCRANFAAVERLALLSSSNRRWTTITLRLIHELGKPAFTIKDAYTFSDQLQTLFPRNHNIYAKIRQQLQVLRYAGIIKFESRGRYRIGPAAL